MNRRITLAHTAPFRPVWPAPSGDSIQSPAHSSVERGLKTRKLKLVGLLVLALVVVTAIGWVALGARELSVFRSTGSPAIINVLTPAVQQGQAAQAGGAIVADPSRERINPAELMPVWMVIDLLIFVALGLYLRWDLGRKN